MPKPNTYTIDAFGPIFLLFVVLLMVGVIPFTPAAIGAGFILSAIHISYTWSRR